MAGVTVATVAAFKALTITELADHLRIDDYADESDVLEAVAASAEDHVEQITGRSLCLKSYYLSLDCFPRGDIPLQFPPVAAITSLKYIDEDGTLQTLDPALYQLDVQGFTARVRPAYSETWPTTRAGDFNTVQIIYTAGYASALVMPAAIKAALKLIASDLWLYREDSVQGSVGTVPTAARALLGPYKVHRFGG
jgi:uncharacterized phiE125 gp8 family phage protein